MLQTRSQSLRKLILHRIKFDKVNLTNIAPNLEILSINNSFENPFGEGKNNFHDLQSLELEDNEIELNKIVLKTKCKLLKFFKIKERELNNEVKEEFILLLSQNYPNITSLCYITDNIIFSSTLKIFKNLCQLQLGEFSYYDLPYSNQDYLQALVYFNVERVKLEVLILPFNIKFDLLPNLRKFVEKAKYLRYIEIVRSKNYKVEKQKDSEKEIIDPCQIRNIKCILKFQLERYKDYFCNYEMKFESYLRTEE
ncbi:17136_t:CDS:2 [Dentiscutata erythropus]|uniref:17136_t:CDS:1 n=1 Tax=Dentiscutata erythropus TaxID=1348616 RepID=A0A9N9EUC4_9GLOM|nr:17136_t:CDS:2 [Dentiscutata erythropus]